MELSELFSKEQALRILGLNSPMMLSAGHKLVLKHDLRIHKVGGYSSAFEQEQILRIINDVVRPEDLEAANKRYEEELAVSKKRVGNLEDYVSRKDAAAELGVSYQTIQNLARDGKIGTVDFGNVSYYSFEDIRAIKDEQQLA